MSVCISLSLSLSLLFIDAAAAASVNVLLLLKLLCLLLLLLLLLCCCCCGFCPYSSSVRRRMRRRSWGLVEWRALLDQLVQFWLTACMHACQQWSSHQPIAAAAAAAQRDQLGRIWLAGKEEREASCCQQQGSSSSSFGGVAMELRATKRADSHS